LQYHDDIWLLLPEKRRSPFNNFTGSWMAVLNNKRLIFSLLLLLTIGIPIAAIVYKLTLVGYSVAELVPVLGYQVDVNMQVNGHGNDISVTTYLPRTDSRQTVMDEENASGVFELSLQSSTLNRIATWQASNVRGQQTIRYRYTVLAKHVRYVIPDISNHTCRPHRVFRLMIH
jgi:hypothetical protein